jgi:tetratricopeptide (TPR) repeat protein
MRARGPAFPPADKHPMSAHTAALLRTAERVHRNARYELAISCFERALEEMPDHQAALFNIAVANIRLRRFDDALYSLNRLERLLEQRDGERAELWFSSRYNRALAHWELAYDDGPNDALENAILTSRELYLELPPAAPAASVRSRSSERNNFLRGVEGPAVSQLAGLITAGIQDDRAPAERPAPIDEVSIRALISGERWRDPAVAQLLAAVARERHDGDVTTRYNLAVYSALRDADELALADLRYATDHDVGLAGWALDDPLLHRLRARHEESFAALAKRHEHRT